jgi:hypothetical protein
MKNFHDISTISALAGLSPVYPESEAEIIIQPKIKVRVKFDVDPADPASGLPQTFSVNSLTIIRMDDLPRPDELSDLEYQIIHENSMEINRALDELKEDLS